MTALKAPCRHGLYDKHPVEDERPRRGAINTLEVRYYLDPCPGGTLLPPDTLVIVKEDGDWPEWAINALSDATSNEVWMYADFLDALAAARTGEETIVLNERIIVDLLARGEET